MRKTRSLGTGRSGSSRAGDRSGLLLHEDDRDNGACISPRGVDPLFFKLSNQSSIQRFIVYMGYQQATGCPMRCTSELFGGVEPSMAAKLKVTFNPGDINGSCNAVRCIYVRLVTMSETETDNSPVVGAFRVSNQLSDVHILQPIQVFHKVLHHGPCVLPGTRRANAVLVDDAQRPHQRPGARGWP